MFNKYNLTTLIVILLSFATIFSQEKETLMLSELIEMGLVANPSIQINRNLEEIAGNNHSLHPFMPSLRASGRMNTSETESKIILASGGEREFRDARSETLNAGMSVTWRLFDGLGMFAVYNYNRFNLSIRELQTRRFVENYVVDVSDQYYRIVVQQHRLEAAQQLMDLSRERFRIIREKLNIGSASGMDLQQAQLDFNADSSYYVRQREMLHNSYIRLNRLIHSDLTESMYVADTILLGTPLVFDELKLLAQENNSALLATKMGMHLTEADIRIAKAGRFPTVDFVSGYSYNRSETPAGVATFSESNGINYGFEASLNIFNGFQVNRNIKNAQIRLENQRLTYDETLIGVLSELHTLYNTYLNNLMMVDFEKQNVAVSRANLDLALERYELGVLSGLGFREFQLGYINAVDRSLDALYQSKVLELSLLVLSGLMEEFMVRIP